MHEKIEAIEKKIVERACVWVEECGLADIDTEELGAITDMIKDLSEARYYETVTKAMEDSDDKMGYDNYRYMRTGRYAPKGRGTYSPGYTPYMMDEPQEFPGYTDDRNRSTDYDERRTRALVNDGGRMGYPVGSNDYGRAYTEYRDRRKAYTENHSAENRRMMEDSAQKHVDETIETFREIWNDVDQPTRVRMKESLTRLVNEMA